jgi:hypothetical protein
VKAWHRTNPFYLQAKLPAAAIMARKGSSAIAKLGGDYFRQLAARRKKHGRQGIRVTAYFCHPA